jgi:hypothetical protein
MDETASFVLDEAETAPGQTDSPSQMSQGTVPIASEGEDTLPHMPPHRRSAASSGKLSVGESSSRTTVAVIVLVAVAAVVGVAIALFSWLR